MQSDSDSDANLEISAIKTKMIAAVKKKRDQLSAAQAAQAILDSDYEPSDSERLSDSSESIDSAADNSEPEADSVARDSVLGEDSVPGNDSVPGDEVENENDRPPTFRKRSRKPEKWQRNLQKKARQAGKEYTRITGKKKGTVAQEKSNSIGKQLCPENSRLNCNSMTTRNGSWFLITITRSTNKRRMPTFGGVFLATSLGIHERVRRNTTNFLLRSKSRLAKSKKNRYAKGLFALC